MVYKRGMHWHMDATVNGVRYREALDTTDRREAAALEKKKVAEIQQGKRPSQLGRDFGRMPFRDATRVFSEERKPHVAERTVQFERERMKPLIDFFGAKPVLKIQAEDVRAYQKSRKERGLSGKTINMEIGVLRLML